MDNNYKLVGYFNFFQIRPGFVYPIFMDNDGNYFWAFSDIDIDTNLYYYLKFIPLPMEYKSFIKFISDTDTIVEVNNIYMNTGDLVLEGIEIEEGHAYIGTIDKFIEFARRNREEFVKNCDFEDRVFFLKELDRVIDEDEDLVMEAKEAGVFHSCLFVVLPQNT